MRDAALNMLARHILTQMAGNSNFPTPTPTLVVVTAKADAFETALSEAGNRDKVKVAIKNKRKEELIAVLNQLFDYVSLTGNGDITILTSSGFPLAKDKNPVGDMPKIEKLKVVDGDGAGEVHLNFKKIHGADSYIYQYTISPSPEVENWTVVYATTSRITFTNLISGTKYMFRVCAVGAKGQGPWSDIISRYVS